jgi:hypothetical protein
VWSRHTSPRGAGAGNETCRTTCHRSLGRPWPSGRFSVRLKRAVSPSRPSSDRRRAQWRSRTAVRPPACRREASLTVASMVPTLNMAGHVRRQRPHRHHRLRHTNSRPTRAATNATARPDRASASNHCWRTTGISAQPTFSGVNATHREGRAVSVRQKSNLPWRQAIAKLLHRHIV